MEIENNQPNSQETPKQKPTSHLRLKIDLKTWHLTMFAHKMNLGPQVQNVVGWECGWLCFVFMFTKRY